MYRRLHAEAKSDADIASALGRTLGALRVKKHFGMEVVSERLVYWTPREDEQLRRLRAEGRSMQDIADILGQTRSRVTSRLQVIEGRQVTKVQHGRWSAERTDLLIRMESEGHKISHIASVLELPQHKVRNKLAALRKAAYQGRLHPRRYYSHDEDETLSSLLGSGHSWKVVLDALPHRSKPSLISRAIYLGIRAPIRPAGDPWTAEDTLKLTTLRTASNPWDLVAAELGRTVGACQVRWCELHSKSASLENLQNSHQ